MPRNPFNTGIIKCLRGIKHDAKHVLDNFEGFSPKQSAWFGSVSYNDALQKLDRFFMANQPTP